MMLLLISSYRDEFQFLATGRISHLLPFPSVLDPLPRKGWRAGGAGPRLPGEARSHCCANIAPL